MTRAWSGEAAGPPRAGGKPGPRLLIPGQIPDLLGQGIGQIAGLLQVQELLEHRAARELGWQYVPLLDAQEVPVPGSLPRCIRVLLLWNTERSQEEIRHVYLRGAGSLRPDLEQARR